MKTNDKYDKDKDLIHGVPRGSDGFEVPEGYFQELPEQVLAKLNEQSHTTRTNGAKIRHLVTRPILAYAAMITGLMIAVVVLLDKQEQSNVFADISTEEAYEYVYDNIEEYGIEDLTEIAGITMIDNEISTLTDDQINIALDEILETVDPSELDELF